jgi:hypothetical protein
MRQPQVVPELHLSRESARQRLQRTRQFLHISRGLGLARTEEESARILAGSLISRVLGGTLGEVPFARVHTRGGIGHGNPHGMKGAVGRLL